MLKRSFFFIALLGLLLLGLAACRNTGRVTVTPNRNIPNTIHSAMPRMAPNVPATHDGVRRMPAPRVSASPEHRSAPVLPTHRATTSPAHRAAPLPNQMAPRTGMPAVR